MDPTIGGSIAIASVLGAVFWGAFLKLSTHIEAKVTERAGEVRRQCQQEIEELRTELAHMREEVTASRERMKRGVQVFMQISVLTRGLPVDQADGIEKLCQQGVEELQ